MSAVMTVPKTLTGVWLTKKKSDVHIDTEQNGFVIAKNNFKVKGNTTQLKDNCSNPALVFAKKKGAEGDIACQVEIFLQYVDENGEIKQAPVSEDIAYDAIDKMLKSLKKKVVPVN